jgi:hypothetical protein
LQTFTTEVNAFGASLAGAGIITPTRDTVPATATTTDLWSNSIIQDWTGTPNITAFPNAPQAGSQRVCYPATGTIITHAGNISVQGNASYTVSSGDELTITSITVSTFYVTIKRKDGVSVVALAASNAEYVTGTDTTKFLNSATARARNIVQGTSVDSTSGTSIDFTGIPSWAKRITIMFSGVSTNGTSNQLIQIGDSGGIENTGYLSSSANYGATIVTNNYTTGFGICINAATRVNQGSVVITNLSSNTWVCSGNLGDSSTALGTTLAGSKQLSATLDRVRITTVNGTDTFDAGSINILYE